MDSILQSIKKLLGLDENYDAFDDDVMMHINSVLMILTQLGVGPKNGFSITGEEETWGDYLGEDISKLSAVKTYVYLKVKTMFDPTSSSVVNEATKEMLKELEWRLNSEIEYKEEQICRRLTIWPIGAYGG